MEHARNHKGACSLVCFGIKKIRVIQLGFLNYERLKLKSGVKESLFILLRVQNKPVCVCQFLACRLCL